MTKRKTWEAIERLMPEVVFRPGNAVGLAHLHRPRDAAATEKLVQLLNQVGIDARIDPKVDHLLLKLPESTLRQVNEYAGQNCMARHEALIMLVKAGLAAADMAERVNTYRQAAFETDIADALAPRRVRRNAGSLHR
jgi:hypothetical protein